mmetsp:Transcript_26312/g.46424  ORF Transcript_26312/g.46424 Transcript_26312/m.46424 type:complete len:294 (-) Transcript_26312:102-983(-)
MIAQSNNPLKPIGSYVSWCQGDSEFANTSPYLNCAKTDQIIPVTQDFQIFSMLLRRAMDSRRDLTKFEHARIANAMKGELVRDKRFERGERGGAYELYSIYALAMTDTAHLVLPIVDLNDAWFDFGVYTGSTANITGHIFRDTPLSIFGIDTFEGLPQEWKGHKPKGFLTLNGVIPPVKPNVKLVKGLFSEKLPKLLKKKTRILGMNVDCMLYQGAFEILEMTAPYWNVGTIIHFHEFQQSPKSIELRLALQDEVVALHQFLSSHPGYVLEMLPIRNDYSEPVIFRVAQVPSR